MKSRTALAYTGAIYGVLALALLLLLACAGLGAAAPPPPAPIALTPPPSVAAPTTASVSAPSPTPPLTPIPNPAAEQTNQRIPYTQITAGKDHACGLSADGVAHCWGADRFGETRVPSRMLFRQISAGRSTTCGLRQDGAVICWGRNSIGQADAPAGLFIQVATGTRHACALNADGAAVCWGDIAGTPTADYAFTAVGSGDQFSCGLTTAGDLQCWGNYAVKVAGPFQALAVGLAHACVLRPDDTAACYGSDWDYQSSPPATAFTQLSAGSQHSCGITRDGVLECWGSGAKARPALRLNAPAGVFTAVSSNWRNNCGLRTNGAAQCWRQPNPARAAWPHANFVAAFNGRVFELPVEMFPWPAGGLAVVDLTGYIKAYDNSANAGADAEPQSILDLTDITVTGSDRGMLSAALDPDFDAFPFLYVYYIVKLGPDPQDIEGRLSRFPIADGVASRADELVIMHLPLKDVVHQGGAIRFGPDGMLYLGLGYRYNAENPASLASLRGKIIRIDVRGATAEQPYRIPDDNPFTATPDARPEIWAYGFRNPWRMDFDAAGNLWVADAGSVTEEEVSIATAGANLGWPVFEGASCQAAAADCAALASATTPPAVSYAREQGGCAIVGGIASPRPELPYIFGDHCSRRIWTVQGDAATGWRMHELALANGNILAFGADAAGTVFVLLHDRPILRLIW